MNKKLKAGDRIIDDDGDRAIVDRYIYPHSFYARSGYVEYTLSDGRKAFGDASGIKKVK